MRIIVETSVGRVVSDSREYTPAEKEAMALMLEHISVGKATSFAVTTDRGITYIGKDLLASSVFSFEEDDAND